ncbi:MAG: hypothetical protein HOM21_11525 [Halobacteriovoraceae bacterium]|jgi:hypothetical protein|nr:hypothetical protein [Halobacteriovoraceae bacterium]
MTEKLQLNTKVIESQVQVELIGAIDEDAHFDSILELSGLKEYHFDFNEVPLINSCGVREWTNFIGKLDASCNIKYFNCRQIIIEQINMVHGFVPANASIETFYAPYFCEDLDKEYKILLKASDVSDKKAPEVKCPDGDNEMEFDAIEEQYFNFIK